MKTKIDLNAMIMIITEAFKYLIMRTFNHITFIRSVAKKIT